MRKKEKNWILPILRKYYRKEMWLKEIEPLTIPIQNIILLFLKRKNN
jgi:hypothetical protein